MSLQSVRPLQAQDAPAPEPHLKARAGADAALSAASAINMNRNFLTAFIPEMSKRGAPVLLVADLRQV